MDQQTATMFGLALLSVSLWTFRVAVTARGMKLASATMAAGAALVYMLSFSHLLTDLGSWQHRSAAHRRRRAVRPRRRLPGTRLAGDLDPGDPDELAADLAALRERLPGLTIVGGCCGTSHTHIDQMARACTLSTTTGPTG